MRSLSESEGRGRATSDYWVGPEPSYVHAMSTTPERGAERMVSFHPSEPAMDDEASGSIARSRLLFRKGRKAKPVLSTPAFPHLAVHLMQLSLFLVVVFLVFFNCFVVTYHLKIRIRIFRFFPCILWISGRF